MKVGVMQPYFFPYLGYFQLIDSVDVYVNLDHVSFMKRSYMVRNTLKNDTKINLNVYNGSQNKKCSEVIVNFENDYINKFKKTLFHLYGKNKNYEKVLTSIINPSFVDKNINVSSFNFSLIESICQYLNIETKLINSSEKLTTEKKGDGLIDIVKHFQGGVYINAIGGTKLYDKEYFKNKSIDLFFLKMGVLNFENPYSSILDLLFMYEQDFIINELKKYSLV
jgi:hypothetical protein